MISIDTIIAESYLQFDLIIGGDNMKVFRSFINSNSGGVVFPSEQKVHEFDMGSHLQTGLPLDVFMSLISNSYPKSDINGIYYPTTYQYG